MADDLDNGAQSPYPPDQTSAPVATTDNNWRNYPVLRAEAYGPKLGEYSYDQTHGPTGKPLEEGNVAISPDQERRYPQGTHGNLVDPETGQVLLANQVVADRSYKKEGVPNSNTIEVWNGKDYGHAVFVPTGGQGSSGVHTDMMPPLGGHFDWSKTDTTADKAIDEDQAEYERRMKEGQPEIRHQDRPSMLEALKRRSPDSKISDDQRIDLLHQKIAPSMDQAKFTQYATTPGGEEGLKKELANKGTGIERARLALPERSGMNDDDFAAFIYGDLTKSGSNLPKAVTEMGDSILGWFTGGSQKAKEWREKFTQQTGSYVPGGHWFKDFLKAEEEWENKTIPGAKQLNQAQSDFEAQGPITEALAKIGKGQQQEAQKEQQLAAQAKGVSGFVGRVGGGLVGSIPQTALMVAGPETAIVGRIALAGGIEAATKFDENLKFGENKAWIEAAKADIVTSGQAWLFNNPLARVKTGVTNMMMGAGYDEIDKWSKGEPSSVGEFAQRASVDLVLGWLMGRKAKELEPHILEQGFEKGPVTGSEGEPIQFGPVEEETKPGHVSIVRR